MFQALYAFGVMFIACEMGQRVNLAFNECNDIIDQFEWYSFPVEIQQMLSFIIHYTQQPVEIKCFGSAACDRETFKVVSLNILNSVAYNRFHVEFTLTTHI